MDKDFFMFRVETTTDNGGKFTFEINFEPFFWLSLGSGLTVLGLFLAGAL